MPMYGKVSSKLLTFVGALALFACVDVPAAGQAAGAAGGSPEASEATAAVAGAPEGGEESCANFARRMCDQAGGDKTQTCTSVKQLSGLLSPKTCEVALADMAFTIAKLEESGKVCAALGTRLCTDLGPDTQTCKMVQGQLPQMPAEQCEQMSGEYDKVLAELQAMEAKNKPLPAEAAAKIAAGDVPSYGLADSSVTVVEFSDFQCPYCSAAANAVTELKSKYGDRVRFVFRQFPLDFHSQAHLAAQASLAANAQGKFWEFHDKLFANQKALERANLEAYAEELGLDMKAFKLALDEGTYKAAVDTELALGKEAFVQGTPTMFINGTRVANATDAASISAELDKALAG